MKNTIAIILLCISSLLIVFSIKMQRNEVEKSYVTKTELREALKEVNANNNPVLLQKMDSIYKTK